MASTGTLGLLLSVLLDVCLFPWLVALYRKHIFKSFSLYLASVFSCLFLAFPTLHLSLPWLSARCTPLPPFGLWLYTPACSCRSIYCRFSGAVLLLVINTRVKWAVTLPGLARRQRRIGRAGPPPPPPDFSKVVASDAEQLHPCSQHVRRDGCGWVGVEGKRREVTCVFEKGDRTAPRSECGLFSFRLRARLPSTWGIHGASPSLTAALRDTVVSEIYT